MRVALPVIAVGLACGVAWADSSVPPQAPQSKIARRCSYDDSPNVATLRRPPDRLLEAARANARVVDGDGRTVGLLRLERLASGTTVTSLLDPRTFAPRWRVDGLHTGDDRAVVLTGDGQLVVATFHFASTGSRLFALELATGTPRWIADVQRMNVAHSEYYNDVTVERVGDEIVLRGYEAGGCYEQRFAWRTGQRLASTMNKLW